jgi:hypothetical protein
VFGKEGNSQILMNLPFTSVPRCTSSNTNTPGLKHLPLPHVGASGGLPDGALVVHHWLGELLIQQISMFDVETTHV